MSEQDRNSDTACDSCLFDSLEHFGAWLYILRTAYFSSLTVQEHWMHRRPCCHSPGRADYLFLRICYPSNFDISSKQPEVLNEKSQIGSTMCCANASSQCNRKYKPSSKAGG